MTIKDKLNLMDEIKAANESRMKAFLQESKTAKHWKGRLGSLEGFPSRL